MTESMFWFLVLTFLTFVVVLSWHPRRRVRHYRWRNRRFLRRLRAEAERGASGANDGTSSW